MASLRDINRRIRSVRSTRQITHTMEMVSTTKIMKALETAAEAAPYKDAIKSMLANVAVMGSQAQNALLVANADAGTDADANTKPDADGGAKSVNADAEAG